MGKPSARSSWCRAKSSTSWSETPPRSASPAAGWRAALRGAALLVLIAAMAPLGGCGFRPLYGQQGGESVITQLAGLDVAAPGTRIGRELKYGLLDSFSAAGEPPANPAYRVELAPILYTQDVAVQQDAAVTRANLVLVVPFKLIETANNRTLLRSTARSRSSYNRVENEFANLSAAQDAEKRTAKAVADDIKMQLSIYFERQVTGGNP